MTPSPSNAALRAWLQDVADQAIRWLDDLDAAETELEDDELGGEDLAA